LTVLHPFRRWDVWPRIITEPGELEAEGELEDDGQERGCPAGGGPPPTPQLGQGQAATEGETRVGGDEDVQIAPRVESAHIPGEDEGDYAGAQEHGVGGPAAEGQ